MRLMNCLSFTAIPDNDTSGFVDGNNASDASELSTCLISDLKACVRMSFYYFGYCHYSHTTDQLPTPLQLLHYKMMVCRQIRLPNSALNYFRKSRRLSKYDLTYLEDKWDQLMKREERLSKFHKRIFRRLFRKIYVEDLINEDMRNDFGMDAEDEIVKTTTKNDFGIDGDEDGASGKIIVLTVKQHHLC